MRGPGRFRTWIYRQLLRSHPAKFRYSYADELIATFTEAWSEQVNATGSLGEVAFWHRLVTREVAAGVAARWQQRREAGSPRSMSVGTDIHLACRSLLRVPGVSFLVVLMLALGIGASTVVYSVVDFALLRPLPYSDPGQLVRVYLADRDNPGELAAVTGAHYHSYRGSAAFEGLAPSYTMEPTYAYVYSGEVPHRMRTLRVGASYFSVLGMQPVVGRTFRRDEERPNAGLVILAEQA